LYQRFKWGGISEVWKIRSQEYGKEYGENGKGKINGMMP